jgi:hypothetical protein
VGLDFIVGEVDTTRRTLFEMPGKFYGNLNPTDSTVSFVSFTSPTDSSVLVTPAASYNITTDWPFRANRVMYVINTSAGTGKIYLNGLDASATGSVKTATSSIGRFWVGYDSLQIFPADCGIDNFKVYQLGLTSTEVLNEYILNPYYNNPSDVTPPVLQSGLTEVASLTTLTFNENVTFTSADSVIAGLNYTKNLADTPITIDSVSLGALASQGSLTITVYTPDLLNTDTLYMDYTQVVSGGIEDMSNNQLATLTDSTIENTICTSVEFAQFSFNDNPNDELGDYNGTDSDPAYDPYGPTSPAEGSHYGNFNINQNYWVQTASMDLGDKFTVTGWFKRTNSTIENVILTNLTSSGNNGFKIFWSGANDYLVFTGINSTPVEDSAYASGTSMEDNAWHHWAFVVDLGAKKIVGYIDGVNKSTDSLISITNFATSGAFRFGSYTNTANSCNCSEDDTQFYDGLLSETAINYIKDNPGSRWEDCPDPGDGPLPDNDWDEVLVFIDTIFTFDADDKALDATYTEADMIPDFTISGYPPIAATAGMGDESRDGSPVYDVSIIDVDAVSDGSGGATRTLKILHEADRYGSIGGTNTGSGAEWVATIPPGRDDLYLTFNMMRNQNAEWVIESKIPCLRGDFTYVNNQGFTGTTILNTGGDPQGAEWHVQTATHGSQGPKWFDPNGVYYHFDVSDSTWYNITYRIVVNTPGNADGFLEGFINGRFAGRYDYQEMSTKGYDIDQASFQFFMGGNQEIYAPSTDQFLLLDDIVIYVDKTGYGPGDRVRSSDGRVLINNPVWDTTTDTKVSR